MRKMQLAVVLASVLAAVAGSAAADITIGVTLSTSGAAAALGTAERNSIELLPRRLAGRKVDYIVLDDGGDAATAAENARKLIAEHRVDALIGSTTTANALAMIEVAAAGETPMIALAASPRLIEPPDEKKRWVFKTPPNDAQMATAIVEHMVGKGVKTVAYLGFADAYGDGWWDEFSRIAAVRKLKVVAHERFRRATPRLDGQIPDILAARPDAVLVGGAGLPAALPPKALRAQGYKGLIYQTHGVASSAFLQACAKDCEGVLLPAGPMLVAEQLPAGHAAKQSALEYVRKYEAAHGKGSRSIFGAHAWDAGLLIGAAVPAALAQARPGSREFRLALRQALENVKNLPAAHGVFNMSADDHLGFDQRARVMVRIAGGAWKLAR